MQYTEARSLQGIEAAVVVRVRGTGTGTGTGKIFEEAKGKRGIDERSVYCVCSDGVKVDLGSCNGGRYFK